MYNIDKHEILCRIKKRYKELKENERKGALLPTITPENIKYHIVSRILLHPYTDNDIIEDNYFIDRVNNFAVVKISNMTQKKFCYIAVCQNDCDIRTNIQIFKRKIEEEKFEYGILIKEYEWYLIKGKRVQKKINFNSAVHEKTFLPFLCWDNN